MSVDALLGTFTSECSVIVNLSQLHATRCCSPSSRVQWVSCDSSQLGYVLLLLLT